MKIYNKVVISIASGEIIEEDSFEYDGPLALAGGGGNSGASDWPQYMKDIHKMWLEDLDEIEIPSMILANPYTGINAFDPDTDLGVAWDAVCEFDAFVDALAHEDDWESATTKAVQVIDAIVANDDWKDAEVAAFADILDDQLNEEVLPQFKAGMRDINAVMTSAFVLGEADIYAKRNRDVAKYASEVGFKVYLQRNDMIVKAVERMMMSLLEEAKLEGDVARASVDAKRIAIVAQKE